MAHPILTFHVRGLFQGRALGKVKEFSLYLHVCMSRKFLERAAWHVSGKKKDMEKDVTWTLEEHETCKQ